jgi:hypothetical protein
MKRIPGTYNYARVPLEGKELKKSLHKHHGDAGYITHSGSGISCPKWFRQNEQHKYRSNAHQELVKYLKNDEYEYIIEANPKLPCWD